MQVITPENEKKLIELVNDKGLADTYLDNGIDLYEGYSTDEIKEADNRAYILGQARCFDNMVNEITNVLEEYEDSLNGKMQKEIAKKIANEIEYRLLLDFCMDIISVLDNEAE